MIDDARVEAIMKDAALLAEKSKVQEAMTRRREMRLVIAYLLDTEQAKDLYQAESVARRARAGLTPYSWRGRVEDAERWFSRPEEN